MNIIRTLVIFISCLIAGNLAADIEVKNHTPYPIQFEMYWIGKLPYFPGGDWVDHAVWPDIIQPGESTFRTGELWNIKTRYIIYALLPGSENKPIKVLDKEVSEGGNRIVNVFTGIDKNGNEQWKIETALR
jgi:hypothetical protein